jgi:5'-3' exonuclease
MRRDPGAPQQNERVLMLLDTPSLYFRAFHGVPESVTAPDGTPVNAVRGLIDMITTLVRRRSPARIAACMDADWRPAFRVAVLPAYKAHRVAADGVTEQVPEALTAQLPVIEQVLDAVGIARIGVPGYEADDVIGTLAARATGAVEIVTGDRDLFQLVDDAKPCRVLYTARGVRALQVVDEAFITERYGIPGRSYADFALRRGDPSDGLPGVPGIGERTAAALISTFGTLSALRAALDEGEPGAIPAAARAKLLAAREYLDAAEVVVRVAADAPVPDTDLTLPRAPRDPELLVTLSERYGLDGPLGRLLDALGAG